MSDTSVRVERHGHVARITLNRPDRANALDAAMLARLASVERELAADEHVRVVVVTGAGSHFCAGIDLREASVASPWTPGVEIGFSLIRQPIIAAINGSAMGGGCEIALACDFRIMSSSAAIGLPEVQFGEVPRGGATARLSRIIGLTQAKLMIMLGEPLDATAAARIGLVDQVTAPDELMATVDDLAQRLAALAPYAVQTAKFLVDRSVDTDVESALALESRVVASMATPEQHETARREAAARSPVYARLLGEG